jgi:uncharacterized integral membrane protein
MRVQSATELAERVARDPELQEQIKADPVNAIAGLATPLHTDVWIYRMVVGVLGLTVLIAVAGMIYLSAMSSPTWAYAIPEALVALGSAAVGALVVPLANSVTY